MNETLKKYRWLILAVIVVVAVYLWKKQPGPVVPLVGETMMSKVGIDSVGNAGVGIVADRGMMPPIYQEAAPVETADRLVVKDTSMSMVVKDVREAINGIEGLSKSVGGYMVDSYLNQPEEAQNGSINIRVPSDKRADVLDQIRKMGVRVIAENVMGTDVTDEYVDVQGRLATLEKTKAKLEQLLSDAANISDILSVQRELNNLQSQIDSLKGREKYLEQTAKLTRISVNLSTDELSLPYAPTEAWRPAVIFKLAVRGLVGTLRQAGELVIWVGVYAPLWIPLLAIVWWLSRRKNG